MLGTGNAVVGAAVGWRGYGTGTTRVPFPNGSGRQAHGHVSGPSGVPMPRPLCSTHPLLLLG